MVTPSAAHLDAVALPRHPVLGFDLDLTLLDMRAGTARALHRVNSVLGEHIDVSAAVADLGPPFREQLRQWVPDEGRLRQVMLTFSRAFLEEGVGCVTPLPGARSALEALARLGGRAVVITGRSPRTAQACLSRCGLTSSALVGGVTGLGKVGAMRSYELAAYLGDHPLDMLAASAVPLPAIGVASGSHPRQALLDAGATAVADSMDEVTGWLESTAEVAGP